MSRFQDLLPTEFPENQPLLLRPLFSGGTKNYSAFITFVSELAEKVRANGSLKREQLPVNMRQLY